MQHLSSEMRGCIDECLRCYQTCLSMVSQHCLPAGGKHVQPEHVRLMLACAESCRTSAHVMLLGTPAHEHTCRACAEVCEACAKSCEAVGDMQECVDQCRRCAETCRTMAG
ncbi:four-helix bundle copper-binding protein [Methylorubrum suomiense]|uniref:Cysteine-rich protein YhjQ n=1 Tax=Methylorubrum suomiense TaxID=144191 RepID=A0ABQ4V1R9_9HYPH|nr:four-helix bundle copper-binding protein [Methylorubrum suomiense]GJE78536.1 putative cysteine-rich protein YhjQ [Methylorubrum suomiense]